jgi:hypothetical protein
MAGLVPAIPIMLAGQCPLERDARDKRGHDGSALEGAAKKKGGEQVASPTKPNSERRDQNFDVNRTVGPLKERFKFEEVIVGHTVVNALLAVNVLRALKYSSKR